MNDFIVSALKYRPATFETVVGQAHITSTLRNAISRGHLAHAYLFCGPRGVGKTTCARIFAKAINCLDPAGADACGQCESCLSFNESRSFNIHELDAASNNSVDDIRALTDQVRIPPQIGRYSVYIIDEVHMLSQAAFNAFLKTLEEPPAHAVFILATTEKHKILPTILSRCQIYDFNRIKVEDGVAYLRYIAGNEGVTSDEESLHLIAQKADGAMRDALSMFDKVVSFCGNDLQFTQVAQVLNVLDYETYFRITDMLLGGDYVSAMLAFDEILRKGFSGHLFIAGLNDHFRNLLLCKNPSTVPLMEVTGAMSKRYVDQAARCDTDYLFQGITLLTATDTSYRNSSNQRLHVEIALMKLCGFDKKKNDVTDAADEELHLPDPENKPAAIAQPAAVGQMPSGAMPALETPPEAPAPQVQLPPREAPASSEETHQAPPAKKSTAVTSQTAAGQNRSITGISIKDILSAPGKQSDTPAEEKDDEISESPQPELSGRIRRAVEAMREEFQSVRPRLAAAFDLIEVDGAIIRMKVPGDVIKDEILGSKPEIIAKITSYLGQRITLGFDIEVVQDGSLQRPVKIEDKLRLMVEKNEKILLLKKELNLDAD